MLARSKLNSIESEISATLINSEIMTIINKDKISRIIRKNWNDEQSQK